MRPFRIVSLQKNKTTIDKNSIPKIVSIDRVTHASSITDET